MIVSKLSATLSELSWASGLTRVPIHPIIPENILIIIPSYTTNRPITIPAQKGYFSLIFHSSTYHCPVIRSVPHCAAIGSCFVYPSGSGHHILPNCHSPYEMSAWWSHVFTATNIVGCLLCLVEMEKWNMHLAWLLRIRGIPCICRNGHCVDAWPKL